MWQNLEKKRNTDYNFPPHYMWAENENIVKKVDQKRLRQQDNIMRNGVFIVFINYDAICQFQLRLA